MPSLSFRKFGPRSCADATEPTTTRDTITHMTLQLRVIKPPRKIPDDYTPAGGFDCPVVFFGPNASIHTATQSAQIKTGGPATSFLVSLCGLRQKAQCGWFDWRTR